MKIMFVLNISDSKQKTLAADACIAEHFLVGWLKPNTEKWQGLRVETQDRQLPKGKHSTLNQVELE